MRRRRRFVPNFAPLPPAVREEVLARQEHRCYVCGRGNRVLAVHHVTARRLGGTNHPDDLVGLCFSCHICVEGAKGSPGYGAALRAAENAVADQLGRELNDADRQQVEKWVRQALELDSP